MKKIIFVSIILLLVSYGCDSNKPASTSKKTKVENCVSPQNPYNDGGGHDAGFNWAAEKGGGCNGNSDSFNEGCAEYHRQMNKYNKCIADSRK
jgi:hypothetical protein